MVQDVYAEPTEALDDVHQTAYETYHNTAKKKKSKAGAYLLPPPKRRKRNKPNQRAPQPGSIEGLLYSDVGNSTRAEAVVRDGDPSIDVLVMLQHHDGRISFLPWQMEGAYVPTDAVPDEETARRIACQRLRLPRRFCVPWSIDATIHELEQMTNAVSIWQNAHLLKGELFLLLDETDCASLCGLTLHYSQQWGLQIVGEENGNGS
ncbi:MAG: hypothetical protein Q4D42_06835 [Eubacteriales bacterium]|nr:hypothetical protein [Eubacteriales bacterium]